MKITLVFLALVLAFSGCIIEETTTHQAYFTNTTNHRIVIVPFQEGAPLNNKIMLLKADTSINVFIITGRGIADPALFQENYFSEADSVVVTFDSTYSITHYIHTPAHLAPKYYLPDSDRNLYNKSSYLYTSEDLNKHNRRITYYYSFLVSDYENALKKTRE